tara:strand:+ start:339 stop:821 length:483 start_codon:yes stop_codon:yes gene_type:complete
MNIYKNFINKKNFNKINCALLSDYFPWYYKPHQVLTSKKNSSYMSHHFVINGKTNSNQFFLLEPILNKLKPKKILNIRANLCLKRPSRCDWHVDKFTDNLTHKTAIYYVNTNNGYTEFKNKKVKCIQNQIVIFDAYLKHRAKIQTDKDMRVVINFNYEYI